MNGKAYDEIIADYICKVLDAKTPMDLLTVILNAEPELQCARAVTPAFDTIIHKIHIRAVASMNKRLGGT